MIYVVGIQQRKWIKVGFSEEETCAARIAQLQTGSPYQLTLLLKVPGTLRQEQALHGALKIALGRIRLPTPPNEWYPGKHPFVVEMFSELMHGVNFAIAYADKYDPAVRQPGAKPRAATEPNLRWA